ncbi:hypothetical protein PGTUg99_023460 [Puccinia graminis f. sp. tritici]|uniref:Uncharacterized protein n=1 Tax=Puccinia graminis f. sp. tritici TaxID=56615 RepID=A0A5B0RLJ5_PUCGR|nr:hypothetical protein PGTUg99_023460 [Puccinia graminis f. sp. tritici]
MLDKCNRIDLGFWGYLICQAAIQHTWILFKTKLLPPWKHPAFINHPPSAAHTTEDNLFQPTLLPAPFALKSGSPSRRH